MDIEPELVKAALGVASKLATDSIVPAAKRYVAQLTAWMKKPDPQEVAQFAIQRVLEEAGAYPPKVALWIGIHAGPADGSQVAEEDRAALTLRIWNRADFPIKLAKLRGALHVNDGAVAATYEIDSPSQFEVGPRQDLLYPCVAMLPRKAVLPKYRYGAVSGAVQLSALVMGPWPDEPHNEHVFDTPGAWLRVEPHLLAFGGDDYDDADLVNLLDSWVANQTASALDAFLGRCELHEPVDLPNLDRELRLPKGSATRLLPSILTKHGWDVTSHGNRTIVAVPSQELALRIQMAPYQ